MESEAYMAQIEIENFSFTWPLADTPALQKINLKIEAGEKIVLAGRSGSGKTTLLRQLKKSLMPHGRRTGTIRINGQDAASLSEREDAMTVGYVMQDPDDQIVTDKVWHELAFGLESLGTDESTMHKRVAEMASWFGIQEWFHKDVSTLSGGQKQLLNLAAVMIMDPQILVLDEPTSQLDPISASSFLQTVFRLNEELGITIILSEQRLEEVIPQADRIIMLDQGRIIADGRAAEVVRELYETGNAMMAAMPTAMRLQYAVSPDDNKHPITVREGRQWLQQKVPHPEILTLKTEPACAEVSVKEAAAAMTDVWFRYGKEEPDVLKGVNLAVPKGTLTAIVGGNGAGKTTLLRTLAGVLKPYRGKIYVDGKRISSFKGNSLYRHQLVLLPQDPINLFSEKSVEEDLLAFARQLDTEDPEAAAAQAVQACEIQACLSSNPYDLSGGEVERCALAKVLLSDPRLLLLDEPTKGMDAVFKQKFAVLLKKMVQEGRTVIIVSHDIEFCARWADRITMFFDGSAVTTDVPSRFFADNRFYTTSASRMSRGIFRDAVTCEDLIELCRRNHAG